jgi:hypothetical protein
VCGEHGGDPESIHFFHDTGLDYVSCSPFRLPVARLEAAPPSADGVKVQPYAFGRPDFAIGCTFAVPGRNERAAHHGVPAPDGWIAASATEFLLRRAIANSSLRTVESLGMALIRAYRRRRLRADFRSSRNCAMDILLNSSGPGFRDPSLM